MGFWETRGAPILHKPFISIFPLPSPILSPSPLCASCFPVEYRLNIHRDDRERNERVGNENLLGLVCISQLWIFQFMLSSQFYSYSSPFIPEAASKGSGAPTLCTTLTYPNGWNTCDTWYSSFRRLARTSTWQGRLFFFYLLHWIHLCSVWFCALPIFFRRKDRLHCVHIEFGRGIMRSVV